MSNKEAEAAAPKQSLSSSSTIPSCLLSTLADLDEKMKLLSINMSEEDEIGDTFAERAESYYQRRPQLLALLKDLYNAYIALSDRYVQTLAKNNNHQHHHHSRHSSQISVVDNEYYDPGEDGDTSHIDSDAESFLSYQPPPFSITPTLMNVDAIVAELVIKNVEYDILLNEVSTLERRCSESSRKIELQKSLLEVLESERLILLNENAKLGYRVTGLIEENEELASESLFMKRKAGELARCVLKLREDHRVCMLSRKVEDLQGQIYGLEKRNKEYYDQLVKRDNLENQEKNKNKNGREVDLEGCFQMEKVKWKRGSGCVAAKGGGAKVNKWWGKVKNMDLFLCGMHPATST